MPANKINRQVEMNLELLTDYQAEHSKWRGQAKKNRDYTLNAQWTEDEESILMERGQSALVVNRIFPVIDQKLAMMTSRKPGVRVLARGDEDVKAAKMMQYVLDYIWYISDGQTVYQMVVNDSLITGVGYFYVYLDKYADNGFGEIKIAYAHGEDVLIDPASKDPLHRDAQHILVVKNITKAQAKNVYPDKVAIINRAHGTEGYTSTQSSGLVKSENQSIFGDNLYPSPGNDNDSEAITIIERYTKGYDEYYRVMMQYGEEEGIEPTEEILNKKDFLELKRGMPDDIQLEYTKFYKPIVNVVCSAGTEMLYEYTLNISNYPIIPVSNVITGTPYSMGEPAFLMGQQDMINKFYSLMIAHATTSTNPKVFMEEGSVEDVDKFRAEYSVPGAVLMYAPGRQAPIPVQPLPLPSALYQMTSDLKYEVEYTSGIFPLQQGSTSGAPQTYSATLAIEEFGNRRVNLKLRNVEKALSQLFTITLELAQQHYRTEKVIRIISPDGSQTESVAINKPLQVNNNGDVVRRWNDMSVGQYDCQVVAGSTAPSNRWAEIEEYFKFYQAGLIDDIAVLNKTELADKDEIIERKSMLSQATQQINQLNQALEASMKEVQQLRKKNQDLEMDKLLVEFEGKLNAVLVKTKAQAEVATKQMNNVLSFAAKEQKLRDTSNRNGASSNKNS